MASLSNPSSRAFVSSFSAALPSLALTYSLPSRNLAWALFGAFWTAFLSSMMLVFRSPLASKSLARWMCSCSVRLALGSQPDSVADEARAKATARATGCLVIFELQLKCDWGCGGRRAGSRRRAPQLLEQGACFWLVTESRAARLQALQFSPCKVAIAVFRVRRREMPVDFGGAGHPGHGLLQKPSAAFDLSLLH